MTRLNIRSAALGIVALMASACGGSTEPIRAATVTLSPATSTKAIGETQQLTAVVADASGNALTGRAITWSSSNTSAATVSTTGLITAVSAGAATINASVNGVIGSATISVTAPVASVVFSQITAAVPEERTLQIVATTKASNGLVLTGRTVTWSTSSAAIATVNASGVISGVKVGTATITATAEGKSSSLPVAVTCQPCKVCAAVPITSGKTINAILVTGTNGACPYLDQNGKPDSTYFDVYTMTISAATTVDINLKSTAFDAYLFLLIAQDTSFVSVAADDDSGGGNDARISGTLATPGTYYILANNVVPNNGGAYQLSFVSPFVAGLRADGSTINPITLEPVTGAAAANIRAALNARRPKRP